MAVPFRGRDTPVDVAAFSSRRSRSYPSGRSTPLLEVKFRDCVSFSARPIKAAQVDRAIDMIRNLDAVAEVGEIVRVLS